MAQLWKHSPNWNKPAAWEKVATADDADRDRIKLPSGPFDESIVLVKESIVIASRKELLVALGKISLACRPREIGQFEAKAWLEVMIEILIQYPRDAILDACAQWTHISQWLPAPSELIALSKPKDAARNRLLSVLTSAKYGHENCDENFNAIITREERDAYNEAQYLKHKAAGHYK